MEIESPPTAPRASATAQHITRTVSRQRFLINPTAPHIVPADEFDLDDDAGAAAREDEPKRRRWTHPEHMHTMLASESLQKEGSSPSAELVTHV